MLKSLLNRIWRRAWFFLLATVAVIGAVAIWFVFSADPGSQATTIKIAAIAALFSALGSFGTLLQALQAQRQREEATRPSVIAYFDLLRRGEINLRVENIGNSPAADVRVRFAEPVQREDDELSLGFLENPISFLPPGGSVRQYFGYAHSILQDDERTMFHAIVDYKSVSDDLHYREDYDLDLGYLRNVRFPEKTFRESVEEIANAIRQHATSSGSVRSLLAPPSTESSLEAIATTLQNLADQIAPDEDDLANDLP